MSSSPVALVTGASSGIGRAIALDLASRGHSLVVTARREDLLKSLSGEILSRWQRPTEWIAADLCDEDGLRRVAARAEQGVDVLVANAGFSTRGAFTALPLETEFREIQLNVLSTVRLCHAAVPSMRQRRSGRILITSSAASFQPLPGLAVYSASKGFLTAFAQSLDGEVRPFGVTVTCLAPGFVMRPGVPIRGPSWLWMTSEDVARDAVVGMLAGRQMVVPGLPWKAISVLAPRLPRALIRRVAGNIGRQMAAKPLSKEHGRDLKA
jgi:uncharacterized protein